MSDTMFSMRSLFLFSLLLLPLAAHAQTDDQYVRAKVTSVSAERDGSFGGMERTVQDIMLEVKTGPDAGLQIELENGILNNRDDMRIVQGETLVLERIVSAGGQTEYLIRDKYRLPALLYLTIFFFALGILLGGKKGATSVLGLAASIAILVLFIVPQIARGANPLFISFVGAVAIACSALYLAHGFNRRTSVALLSTMITLLLSTLLAMSFVYIARLFGMGSEESVFLQFGELQNVNLKGLLLGGIIIGALGVLDDITTAQTAAVDELSKANPSLGFSELYRRGTSIGHEHIASLINTLALAYAGASMPLLLLFSIDTTMPLWAILNGEFMAEEIVRTLVGSATLLLAVPISTFFAARAFSNGRHTHVQGHTHTH